MDFKNTSMDSNWDCHAPQFPVAQFLDTTRSKARHGRNLRQLSRPTYKSNPQWHHYRL